MYVKKGYQVYIHIHYHYRHILGIAALAAVAAKYVMKMLNKLNMHVYSYTRLRCVLTLDQIHYL